MGLIIEKQIRQVWNTSRGCAAAVALLLVVSFSPAVRAEQITVDLDPGATQVEFTLGATMHTVHGTFKLKNGQIRVDPATGKASGSIVLDATSGDTDNTSRDKKMHSDILESAKFPEITFTPNHVKGDVGSIVSRQATAQIEISGVFRLHGQDHDSTMTMSVQPGAGGHINATTQFPVPYIQWGLKSPNTFLLHVADSVDVTVHASGKISATP